MTTQDSPASTPAGPRGRRTSAASPDARGRARSTSRTTTRAEPTAPPPVPDPQPVTGRIPVEVLTPVADAGRYPAKGCEAQPLSVQARVYREGHDAVAATVVLTGPDGDERVPVRMADGPPGTELRDAVVVPDAIGSWTFRVEGWSDPYGTWHHEAEVKIPLEQDVDLVCEAGARLLERLRDGLPAGVDDADRALVDDAVTALRDTSLSPEGRVVAATSGRVADLAHEHPVRELVSPSAEMPLWVDRTLGVHGSWYELFPRSEGAAPDADGIMRSGTFRDAERRLPAVADMGFDLVYLPPVHPVGREHRKGPNNTLTPGPHDPGSPWAVGSAEGGHDAVHPDLGTLEDFDHFVATAKKNGLEVALDLAIQCAPDHPWVAEHPEWFTTRVDGSIAYAENPPKKYQDIYPVNFDRDPEGIYAEVERVCRFWMDRGIRVFRVDNPHTKPVRFWEWLIARLRATDPDLVLLSEAFTRPAMLQGLAKAGFTQSYTYFTWRTERTELEEFFTGFHTPVRDGGTADYLRPNFFVNTPDILHASLQYGGPAAFAQRAVLATTASPTWGMYSGYELYEHVAVRPGSEEYLDTEKFQYRPRDWDSYDAADTLVPLVRVLNRARREHPALQRLGGFALHDADSPDVLAYSRRAEGAGPDGTDDVVLVVVNLDPHGARETTLHVDVEALGLEPGEQYVVDDVLTGDTYTWGEYNYVRLDPARSIAHVLTVRRQQQ